MANVFCGPLPSLLMNQVEVAESRVLVGIQFEERSLSDKFVSCGNSIVARTSNISGSIFSELISIELKQTDVRARALLGIKIGLDFGHRFHKAKVQTESIGGSLNLLH